MHCTLRFALILGTASLAFASPLRVQVSYVSVTTVYRGAGTSYLSECSPTGISAGTGTYIGKAYLTGPCYLSGNSSLTYNLPGYSYATTKSPAPSPTPTAQTLQDCYVQCGESNEACIDECFKNLPPTKYVPTTLVLATLSAFDESSRTFQYCASQCGGANAIVCINVCELGLRQAMIQASATVPASTSASPTPSLSPYALGGAVWQACTLRCDGTDPSCIASCEVDYQNGAPDAVSVNLPSIVVVRSPAYMRDSLNYNSDGLPAAS